MPKNELSFKPREITKKLLVILPERNRDVLTRRFGLNDNGQRSTLESIGAYYKITRERVRQIENTSLQQLKKSPVFAAFQPQLNELSRLLERHGGVVHEQEFLDNVATAKTEQNHLHFLMVLSDVFTHLPEDDEFHSRWTTNPNLADRVRQSIRNLCQNFSEQDVLSEGELIGRFLKELRGVVDNPDVEKLARRWLSISKLLGKNPLGEWGLRRSPSIRLRGIRDWAYLVLRQEKKPLHFSEVAEKIRRTFGRLANAATCHNELIKDKRFVLVGRGIYALSEWGYQPGTVREVIKRILKRDGPLTKEQIIKTVLRERQVKLNTILVNLQNKKFFRSDDKGRFVAI